MDPYRSTFTAQEIELILQSVGGKLNANAIVTDIDTGGTTNVVAAETLKTVINNIITNTTGDGLKAAINAADDSNVFTDTYKNALDSIALKFIGTITNLTQRDALDTSTYIGGEVILLLSNESEQPVFQYWNNVDSNWKDVYRAESREVITTSVGAVVLKQFPQANFVGMDFSIIAKSPSSGDFHITNARVGWKGDDVFITTFGDLYNDAPLFTLDAEVVTATSGIAFRATTVQANTSFFIEVINAY